MEGEVRQIKGYLSDRYDIETVLMITSTEEYRDLEKWLYDVKGIRVIRHLSESEALPEKIDALIFDWNCKEKVLSLKSIQPGYLIGRMKKEEDYFEVWETYRERASFIYIEQDRGLKPEQITADIAPCEILNWQKGKWAVELSVVLPVYNVSNYLPDCMKTLLEWKAPYVEYIFVNDGSADPSGDLILKYAQTDPRIRLIDKENGGCASARNRGIEAARGRYIGFVDPDDFIDASMFYKLFRRAIMGSYHMVYCGYKEYYEEDGSSREIRNDCLKDPYLTGTYSRDKVALLAVNTRVAIWRAIYRKDVLDEKKIRFHEELKRFDDLPFRVEYIFAAGSAACVPEHLYYYRLGRQGQDVSCRDERLFVHFPLFDFLDAYVDAFKDERLTDLLQVVKIQTHGYALSKIEKKYKKEYLQKAKKQLDRNMGYWRTVSLILLYTGKGNLGWYTGMRFRIFG